jgi:hypothetical protein
VSDAVSVSSLDAGSFRFKPPAGRSFACWAFVDWQAWVADSIGDDWCVFEAVVSPRSSSIPNSGSVPTAVTGYPRTAHSESVHKSQQVALIVLGSLEEATEYSLVLRAHNSAGASASTESTFETVSCANAVQMDAGANLECSFADVSGDCDTGPSHEFEDDPDDSQPVEAATILPCIRLRVIRGIDGEHSVLVESSGPTGKPQDLTFEVQLRAWTSGQAVGRWAPLKDRLSDRVWPVSSLTLAGARPSGSFQLRARAHHTRGAVSEWSTVLLTTEAVADTGLYGMISKGFSIQLVGFSSLEGLSPVEVQPSPAAAEAGAQECCLGELLDAKILLRIRLACKELGGRALVSIADTGALFTACLNFDASSESEAVSIAYRLDSLEATDDGWLASLRPTQSVDATTWYRLYGLVMAGSAVSNARAKLAVTCRSPPQATDKEAPSVEEKLSVRVRLDTPSLRGSSKQLLRQGASTAILAALQSGEISTAAELFSALSSAASDCIEAERLVAMSLWRPGSKETSESDEDASCTGARQLQESVRGSSEFRFVRPLVTLTSAFGSILADVRGAVPAGALASMILDYFLYSSDPLRLLEDCGRTSGSMPTSKLATFSACGDMHVQCPSLPPIVRELVVSGCDKFEKLVVPRLLIDLAPAESWERHTGRRTDDLKQHIQALLYRLCTAGEVIRISASFENSSTLERGFHFRTNLTDGLLDGAMSSEGFLAIGNIVSTDDDARSALHLRSLGHSQSLGTGCGWCVQGLQASIYLRSDRNQVAWLRLVLVPPKRAQARLLQSARLFLARTSGLSQPRAGFSGAVGAGFRPRFFAAVCAFDAGLRPRDGQVRRQ